MSPPRTFAAPQAFTPRPRPASICYAMGITQHTVGTDNVKSLANLAMLCGNIGIEGGGSTPFGARTTSRGPATWAACPTSFPVISR